MGRGGRITRNVVAGAVSLTASIAAGAYLIGGEHEPTPENPSMYAVNDRLLEQGGNIVILIGGVACLTGVGVAATHIGREIQGAVRERRGENPNPF